jgi:hypothetical protein
MSRPTVYFFPSYNTTNVDMIGAVFMYPYAGEHTDCNCVDNIYRILV